MKPQLPEPPPPREYKERFGVLVPAENCSNAIPFVIVAVIVIAIIVSVFFIIDNPGAIMENKQVFWLGPVPTECDTCGGDMTTRFYDAQTDIGPWASMCPSCHHLGPGLGRVGPGKGQEFTKQSDGRWLKTAG